jgi:hypothetical protein
MRRRESFIWGFLIAVSVILIFYIGIQTYTTSKEVRKFQQQEAEAVLGTDKQLLETVTSLENELKERLAYIFETEKDPLKLTAVIKSPKLLAAMGYDETEEGEESMRLSLTVLGAKPYASIEYMGSYHDVRVGDFLGGYKIVHIGNKEVVIAKAGTRLVLKNRLKPETILEQRRIEGDLSGNF